MAIREETEIKSDKQQQVTRVGNIDTRLHASRKFVLTDGNTYVCGAYGPGTSQELTANWSMPLQDMTPGRAMQAGSAVVQGSTQMTMIKSINSLQVWQGNDPYNFSLEARFYALQDPETEVMQPLRALEWFIAPDIGSFIGGPGTIAPKLTLNLGTKIIWDTLILKSLSIPFDKETDSQGRFVRATVTLSLATERCVTRDHLKKGYGLRSGFQYR